MIHNFDYSIDELQPSTSDLVEAGCSEPKENRQARKRYRVYLILKVLLL